MKKVIKRIFSFLQQHPVLSFFLSLAILFAIIFVSDRMRSQIEIVEESRIVEKSVQTMQPGNGQYAQLSGKIEKDGIVTIYAHVSGIVHGLYVDEGQKVYRGQRIAYLSETYGGGNTAAVGHQIAARQREAQDETFEKRISTIDDQRDDVPKTSDLASAIARKQFTLQKRNAERDYDVIKLQEKQAAVSAAKYVPSSPFKGVVDRVFVSRGETVNVGDRVAVVNADDHVVNLSINVSAALASIIDVVRASTIYIDGQEIAVFPEYISQDVADDQSYVLTYVIGEQYTDLFEHNEFIDISVPIETQSHATSETIVPLDAVRLMSENAVVFVAEDGFARARNVTVGEVVGGFIFVNGSIGADDEIILNRNVFDGDRVAVSM